MTRTLREIEAASDEQLVAWQDEVATGRGEAHDYYLSALRARQQQRAIESSEKLARRAYWLTVANTGLAAVAAVAAVIALFLVQH